MIERAEFDAMPPEDERDVWCEWLRRHSIDPNDVVVPGWIERRPADYQVAYRGLHRGSDGQPQLDEHRWVRMGTLIAQLEGPPLPFPRDT